MSRHVALGRQVLGRCIIGAVTVLVASTVACGARLEPTAPAQGAGSAPEASAEPVVPARRAASVVRPERPRSARLPSGIVVPVKPVSTGADGVLAVPHDIRTAGWWRGGSRLGDPFGSTLIAAHIDSVTQGLGPYAELLRVRPGQHIQLGSATLRQTFVVRSLRLVPQGPLTRYPAIYAASGERRLTLVTCAPPYLRSRGGYQNLAIVTATPISDPLPRTR